MKPLEQVQLLSLMKASSGSADLTIGVIDGPVDINHPAFEKSQINAASEAHLAACKTTTSAACLHGTFVTGILCAKFGVPAPGICPSCKIVLWPVFTEEVMENVSFPISTPEKLVAALIETVDSGARIINLSLGVAASSLRAYRELEEACDYARRHGAILVAAAGNQGSRGYVPLINHSWVIPVAACDEQGRPSPESNLNLSIGTRGLMAPGVDISSTSPGGHYTKLSGTSAATPFVTGTVALLWSQFPQATAAEIRNALLVRTTDRRAITPPLLNAEVAWHRLKSIHQRPYYERRERMIDERKTLQEVVPDSREHLMSSDVSSDQTQQGISGMAQASPAKVATARREIGRVIAQGGGGAPCPTCAAATNNEASEPASFVYALGTIKHRFPNLSVEKEFAQAVKEGQTANLTDTQVIYNILRANRYLAQDLCWVFTIEGLDTYILVPKDPLAYDQLIEALNPAVMQGIDIDVLIGVRGPVAPAEVCNGLMVPIVVFDRIFSFDRPTFINAIPRPEGMEEKAFRATSDDVLTRIQQLADNLGATDEHRALNFVATRYPAVYAKTAEMHANNYSLTGVDAIPSRLSNVRKLVDVVLSYTNRNTDVVEKYYMRMDVTEKYPFLASKLAPFYDRS